jgi:uncharacterized protein
MSDSLANVLIGLVMVVGLVGVLVPVLPGTALVLAAGVAWAVLVADEGVARWVVVGLMAALFLAGLVAKYVLPGRRLSGQLPRSTLVVGAIGSVVGFFAVPPFGLLIGGALGVYLAEVQRVGFGTESARSTVAVFQAVGIGILAELTAGVLMVATWLAAVAFL